MWQQKRLKRGLESLLTWKSNVKLLLFTLSVICLNFIVVPQAQNFELEGAVYASSGSSFEVPEKVVEKGDEIRVCYMLAGGMQNVHNKESLEAFSGNKKLYTPYRYGYRFSGWYTDSGRRKQMTKVPTNKLDHYVLYAKWTPQIDNVYNVENYEYQSETGRFERKTVALKDLEYSFWDKIDIPGMPETRADDLLNQHIFSESQCPQGICLTDEFVLITSYSTEDDCMGELMVFDRETGEYMITLGMDENSHLGGIAYDGDNVWVCNSHENTIERISYDFLQMMAYQNKGEVVDVRDVVDEYPVKNTPSCITYYGGRLWIATHTLMVNSRMLAYHLDDSSNKLVSLSEFKIPSKVQGVAFDQSGRVYLSTSYGRSQSSYLLGYDSVTSLSTSPKNPDYKVEMPPCSEEIDVSNETIYILFESAGEKYLEGTDGKGQSLSPIDKLLMIPTEQISLDY